MIYITTRRVGDLAWVRMNDIILPNLAQAGAIWEAGIKEKAFTRMSLTRWTVPIDDTSALVIGVRHFNEGVNDPEGRHSEAGCGKETVDFLGQTGERSYDERQRVPGDFDAQVSQRPIAESQCCVYWCVRASELSVTAENRIACAVRLVR
jgi:hypothetical protein